VLLPAPVSRVAHGRVALEHLLRDHPDSDAAFCVVDGLAAGVVLACRRRGIDVPGRLAVAGFGGFEIAEPDALDITTLAVPGHEIGRQAGAMLLARLEGEPPPEPSLDVGFTVIRRGSA
jgi:LacI family transcriptional regulator, gluconate utilization system Gnt-I transcriptional repressor